MKKLLSMLLVAIMLLCLMPTTTVFAAKENFIAIDEVTINEVYSPAAGTEVQFNAKCITDHITVNAIRWYEKKTESESGTALSQGAKFKPGYYYTVSVELKISHNAYYFKGNGSSVNTTINGKAAINSTDSAQVMTSSYTYPMCLGTVSKFEFNLAAPTAGKAPHYPLLTGTGYETNNRGNNGAAYKNGIYWRNETDNKVLYPDENPKFEEGKTYSANITVATTTGYRVSSSYTVKVNSKTVTATKVDNECITFKVEFTVPKSHTHTDSEWKTDDTNHWKVCTDATCGAVTVSNEAHKDSNKDNKCDVCSYKLITTDTTSKPTDTTPNNETSSTPDTPSQPDTSSQPDAPSNDEPQTPSTDTTVSDTEETVGEVEDNTEDTNDNSESKGQDDKDSFPWIWVVIAAVVVIAGGAVAFVLIKKKKAE